MATDILVVDDEADIRDLVAGILSDEGYAVRTAQELGVGARFDRCAKAGAAGARHLDERRRH